MPIYYSPTGNREMWDTKPTGYFTPSEWESNNPQLFPPTPNHDWNGSAWVINSERAKSDYKTRMDKKKEEFVENGTLVTMTVDSAEYTGAFHPTDEGFRSASASCSYRIGVDSSVPPVDFGSDWSCKDDDGNIIDIPMTEALLAKLGHFVHNWHTSCNKSYVERRDLMFRMSQEQLGSFNPEQDMIDNLPSRNITIP